MKNILKLLIGLFITIITFISCNKNEENVENNQLFIDAKAYGEYHNELLKSYHENNGKAQNFLTLYDELNSNFNKSHVNILSEKESLFYRNRLLKIGAGNLEITKANYFSITEKGIKEFYSLKTQQVLLKLLHNAEEPNEVLNNFNNLIIDNDISIKEKNEIEKMKNVYNASIIYWSNEKFNLKTNNTSKCNPSQQVFFADAVGCMFGGLGSVGYSWAIYSLQNGGGCL